MDARRLKLYELLKPKLDEEPARELVLALGPDRDQLATKDDLGVLRTEMRADMGVLRADMVAMEARIVDKLTWRMITVMGAWTVVATSLFAFMSQLFQR